MLMVGPPGTGKSTPAGRGITTINHVEISQNVVTL
jgi:adenylate kinase family enzyme